MTTEVIEYTYTTYRTPQQQEHEINYYVDFAEQLDTYLRNKGFLPDRGHLPEKTQIFWCTFPSQSCGICFLLRSVPYNETPDTWFGTCQVVETTISTVRIWKPTLELTNGLQWFTAPYGISPRGSIVEQYSPNESLECIFGFGYSMYDTTYRMPDHHRIVFGFQQNDAASPTAPRYPRFILPSKGMFLEGMHVDICDITGDIPLYKDEGNTHNTNFWAYKELSRNY